MSDRLRIGTFDNNGHFNVALDINDGTNYALVRDTLTISPLAGANSLYATSGRRYGGAKQVGEVHANGQITGEWYINSSARTTSATLVNFDSLVGLLETTQGPYYLEFRFENGTTSAYYELRGMDPYELMYKWIETVQTATLHAKLTFQVAPLALGDPFDVYDKFATNTLGDYTALGNTGIAWTAGALTATSSLAKLYLHTARGYKVDDAQVTLKFTTGTVGATTKMRSVAVAADASNYLFAEADSSTNVLRIGKVDAGVTTSLTTVPFTMAGASIYWLRFRQEGGILFAEAFTSAPTPNSAPLTSTSYLLSSAEQTRWGAGVLGYTGWYEALTTISSAVVNEFDSEPFTYRNIKFPDSSIVLRGIPGSAPAKVDVVTTPTNAEANFVLFGLHAWTPDKGAVNELVNGHFEDPWGFRGWDTTAVTNQYSGATSLGVVTSGPTPRFGKKCLQFVTAATVGSGANYEFNQRFRRGVTYTFEGWISASATTNLSMKFGNPSQTASSSTFSLAANTWTFKTMTWTPTQDYDYASVGVGVQAATITTISLDGMQVYEGTVAPTSPAQFEGRGATAPFGIYGVPIGSPTISTPSANADTDALSGFSIPANSALSSGTTLGEWVVDPNSMTPDDWALDEVDIEVWARISMDSTIVKPVLQAYAAPVTGATPAFAHGRLAADLPNGKALVVQATGNRFQLTRVGTVSLPVLNQNKTLWKFGLFASWDPGSTGTFRVAELILNPSRSRSSSPTDESTADGGYPNFCGGFAEISRKITSNLQGYTAAPPDDFTRDIGLGGSLIELPPGNVRFLTILSSVVPGDQDSGQEETRSHVGSQHFAVQPRYHLARSH